MNCIKCELTRAKLYAGARFLMGATVYEVAASLSERYGERYYVEGEALYRASKLPPYKPHLLWGNHEFF